ncbi:MAG TPA: glycosyltransferase [Prolixibacteraceae bacterium]|nr:glycosyltransferase [Prolixibacteraceae bacterium]HPS11706.1 glycosyltransferase [Prolixibacteraceae bacterium]
MKLSVVIVNYNVKHFLEQCLHSVEKASRTIETEVFVVDNNSVDGSKGMLISKFPQVKLILNEKNVGFAKANNQAMRLATGDYILLLNPDTVVEEDTFEKVIAFMNAHPEAGGLGVKMIDGKGKFLPESKRGLPTPWVAFYKIFGLSRLFPRSKVFGRYHLTYLDKNETHEIDVLAGAFMLMRKEALDKVGLLDEDFFMYGEDIDLSYRITLGGYKNYYYPGTTIIHYKGESTKKGSLNYVRMFYNAMIIFANKHFSKQYAGFFAFFIHLAIYFRAALATTSRIVKKLWLPLLDFIFIFLGFFWLLPVWENLKYGPDYYPDTFIYVGIPAYILVWLISTYYSGGYEKPVSLFRIFKGIISGTFIILIIYSLLPNSARFSRAVILLGAVVAYLAVVLIRLFLHFGIRKDFTLGAQKPKRIAIVGFREEALRVEGMLGQTGVANNLLGYISPVQTEEDEAYIGSAGQIDEIVRINNIEELIFCSADISSQMVIKTMLNLSGFNLEYKIAPPGSVSIIGSNSIDTAGDLYVVNVNAITREKNRRNKRLFDIVVSLVLLISSPFTVWFISRKGGFFHNIFKVLGHRFSWVGYHKINTEMYLGLPVIKPGILKTTDRMDVEAKSNEAIDRANMLYARDYSVSKDFEMVMKAFKKLGQL